jgi:hypothetical protein
LSLIGVQSSFQKSGQRFDDIYKGIILSLVCTQGQCLLASPPPQRLTATESQNWIMQLPKHAARKCRTKHNFFNAKGHSALPDMSKRINYTKSDPKSMLLTPF